MKPERIIRFVKLETPGVLAGFLNPRSAVECFILMGLGVLGLSLYRQALRQQIMPPVFSGQRGSGRLI